MVAEEYPAQALIAHEEHGGVRVPLPVLDPVVDPDALADLSLVAGANGDAPPPRGLDDAGAPETGDDDPRSYPRRLS